MDRGVLGQNAGFIVIGGVDLGLVSQGDHDGAGDEGQDVQLGLVLGLRRVQVGAQLLYRRHVDFLDIGDVGNAAHALGHLLRNLAAQADDLDLGRPLRLRIGRAAGQRRCGLRTAARDKAVQILVRDPTRRAGTRHEGQIYTQVPRAIAHGRQADGRSPGARPVRAGTGLEGAVAEVAL